MPLLETLGVIVGIFLLVLIILLICNLPYMIRSRRMAKVAKEFNLSFSKGKGRFQLLVDTGTKRNIISGNIKGHTIEAYDFDAFVWATRGLINHEWVLVVDSNEQQIKSFPIKILGTRTSVHKIRNILRQISHS